MKKRDFVSFYYVLIFVLLLSVVTRFLFVSTLYYNSLHSTQTVYSTLSDYYLFRLLFDIIVLSFFFVVSHYWFKLF